MSEVFHSEAHRSYIIYYLCIIYRSIHKTRESYPCTLQDNLHLLVVLKYLLLYNVSRTFPLLSTYVSSCCSVESEGVNEPPCALQGGGRRFLLLSVAAVRMCCDVAAECLEGNQMMRLVSPYLLFFVDDDVDIFLVCTMT